MSVTFIKRECDRHPGCFTMSDKCDRCHDEDFRARLDAITRDFIEAVGKAFARVSS